MIAKLNFEKSTDQVEADFELAPGLRRIDELLAAVLARYEQVEGAEMPSFEYDRRGCERGEDVTASRSPLSKVFPR